MNPSGTVYLLMYDITNDQILPKIARMLEKHGFERINYSVWLGWHGPKDLPELYRTLREMLNKPETKGSRLFYMPLSINNLKKLRSISGHKPAELDYWTGESRIRFF